MRASLRKWYLRSKQKTECKLANWMGDNDTPGEGNSTSKFMGTWLVWGTERSGWLKPRDPSGRKGYEKWAKRKTALLSKHWLVVALVTVTMPLQPSAPNSQWSWHSQKLDLNKWWVQLVNFSFSFTPFRTFLSFIIISLSANGRKSKDKKFLKT